MSYFNLVTLWLCRDCPEAKFFFEVNEEYEK